jgi:hypothetical protein
MIAARSSSLVLVAVFVLHASALWAAGEKFRPPAAEEILKTLRPAHPRLKLDADAFARLRKLVASDGLAGRIYKQIKSNARKMLTSKPSTYEIPDGRRLLSVSRRVLDRVRTLAFVHRIEGRGPYARRAWAELEAAAQFKDWNPKHFLDTAEMTHALAIGYDWLYDQWTDDQRKLLREAIVTKGLKEALRFYQPKPRSWAKGTNNWNQVCNGGIGMGALAIAEDEPKLAVKILHAAIKSIPLAMRAYAPDGAGTEGVTYWSYGTRYNTAFLASLASALGTDFGLSKLDVYGISGDYHLYMSGASRMAFNFCDCGLARLSAPQHFWIGRRYKLARASWFRYAELQRSTRKAHVNDLVWYDPSGADFDITTVALDKHFREAEIASMRSDWKDPHALVVGIQGSPTAHYNHRHLDAGTFILEALGERWLIDLGSERQTYMRHKHSFGRWDFYRIRAEGHNTLMINPRKGPDQITAKPARIKTFESTPRRVTAVVNLSHVYAAGARRVERTFAMIERKVVTVTDTIEADKPVEVWSFYHTRAAVKLDADGRAATLSQNGKQLRFELIGPSEAKLQVLPAEPLATSPDPDIQAKNTGVRKLAVHVRGVKKLKLTVKLTPQW